MRPTWAEINLDAIRHNLQEIRMITPAAASITAVVKANAYGHGVMEVTRTVLACGVNHLAVAIPEEGIFLRQQGITVPIMILGLTLPDQAEEMIQYNLNPTVATWDSILALASAAQRLGKTAHIFIKLDTGMNRVGVFADEAAAFVQRAANLAGIVIHGLFSHFAIADSSDKTYTRRQFKEFQQIVAILEGKGIRIPHKSMSNSAAIIDLPHMHLDFVRPGIILYGLAPSDEVGQTIKLIPAMQFKSRIVYLKRMVEGSKVGYGCTYTAQRDTTIATLPVGYADGYSRLLSNKGEVLISGMRCPVIGRVCMDQIMVDVTRVPSAAIGDEAVLFGKQGAAEITIDEVAGKIGTINYELVCSISARVPRVYIGE